MILQVDDEKFLRQRELFWAHKLENFYPNGLNQRKIYAAYQSQGFFLINLVTVKRHLSLYTFKYYYYLHLVVITFFIRITFIYPNSVLFFGTHHLLMMIPC